MIRKKLAILFILATIAPRPMVSLPLPVPSDIPPDIPTHLDLHIVNDPELLQSLPSSSSNLSPVDWDRALASLSGWVYVVYMFYNLTDIISRLGTPVAKPIINHISRRRLYSLHICECIVQRSSITDINDFVVSQQHTSDHLWVQHGLNLPLYLFLPVPHPLFLNPRNQAMLGQRRQRIREHLFNVYYGYYWFRALVILNSRAHHIIQIQIRICVYLFYISWAS